MFFTFTFSSRSVSSQSELHSHVYTRNELIWAWTVCTSSFHTVCFSGLVSIPSPLRAGHHAPAWPRSPRQPGLACSCSHPWPSATGLLISWNISLLLGLFQSKSARPRFVGPEQFSSVRNNSLFVLKMYILGLKTSKNGSKKLIRCYICSHLVASVLADKQRRKGAIYPILDDLQGCFNPCLSLRT